MLKTGIGSKFDRWDGLRAWDALWHLRLWIGLFALLGASMGVFYASSASKLYSVTSIISGGATTLKQQDVAWFQSPVIITAVVDDLALFNDPEFNGVHLPQKAGRVLSERLFPTNKNMKPEYRRTIAIETLKAQTKISFNQARNAIALNTTTRVQAKSEKILRYFAKAFMDKKAAKHTQLDIMTTGTVASSSPIPAIRPQDALSVETSHKTLGFSTSAFVILFAAILAILAASLAFILGGLNLYTKKLPEAAPNFDGINQSETIIGSIGASRDDGVIPELPAETAPTSANDNEGETPEKDDLEMYSNQHYPWQNMMQPMDNGHAMGQPMAPQQYPYYPQQAPQPYPPQGQAHAMAGYAQPARQAMPQPAPQMMPQQQYYAPQPPQPPMQQYMPQPAPQMMMPPQPYYAPQPPMPFMQQAPQQAPMMPHMAPSMAPHMAPNMAPSMVMEEFDELLNEDDDQFDAERYQALRTRIRRLRSALRDAA